MATGIPSGGGGVQLCCAAEDAHRARLLVDALDRLGSGCELRCEPPSDEAGRVLVVWTTTAAVTPWLRRIFAGVPDAVAIAFDPVAPPSDCTRAVDLGTWPARSADANLSRLSRWLKTPASAPRFGQAEAARLRRENPDGGSSSRSRGDEPDRQARVAGLVLVILLAGVVGLFLLGDGEDGDAADGPQPAVAEPRAVVSPPDRVTTERQASTGGQLSVVQPSASDTETGLPAATADPGGGQDSPAAIPPPNTGSRRGNDSVSHFCRSRTVAAALAWYGVLDAAQRRQAQPCAEALLRREGFDTLGDVLASRVAHS